MRECNENVIECKITFRLGEIERKNRRTLSPRDQLYMQEAGR